MARNCSVPIGQTKRGLPLVWARLERRTGAPVRTIKKQSSWWEVAGG